MDRPTERSPETTHATPGQRFWLIAALVGGAALILIALFGGHGVIRELQFRKAKQTLSAELSGIEAQNLGLRREIDALRNNGKYVETIARRDLGMVKPDEIIYQFPASGEKATKAAPAQDGH